MTVLAALACWSFVVAVTSLLMLVQNSVGLLRPQFVGWAAFLLLAIGLKVWVADPLVTEPVTHGVLLGLVPAEHPDLGGAGVEQPGDHRLPERSGASGDQEASVRIVREHANSSHVLCRIGADLPQFTLYAIPGGISSDMRTTCKIPWESGQGCTAAPPESGTSHPAPATC